MIIRTYNFDNEKQASQFDKLYVKIKQNKKLTIEETALGIGRYATEEELVEFFEEDAEDLKLIPSEEVFKKHKT